MEQSEKDRGKLWPRDFIRTINKPDEVKEVEEVEEVEEVTPDVNELREFPQKEENCSEDSNLDCKNTDFATISPPVIRVRSTRASAKVIDIQVK
ncbi:MAG: hypothetical protein ACOYJ1_09775 [Peptococcales bacterium]|jgi:hypothetical protein